MGYHGCYGLINPMYYGQTLKSATMQNIYIVCGNARKTTSATVGAHFACACAAMGLTGLLAKGYNESAEKFRR
jgi:hypothetical protein